MKIDPSSFTLNGNVVPGSKICIALEGSYPYESIYCAAKQDGRYIGSFDRSPSYPINFWSWNIANSKENNTCYISLDGVDSTKPIEIYALMYGDNIDLNAADVYIAY